MKIILVIFLVSICFFNCTKKCGECAVVEYDVNGVNVINEIPMGEYCGSDAKHQAEEKAIADGITCNNCHVECK